MDREKVDNLIAFLFACAARQDDFHDRELAPIQIIKLIYLADVDYAKATGETFSQAAWRFHHFGPWDAQVQQRIEPVARKLNAASRTIRSSDGSGSRYRLDPSRCDIDALFYGLERKLPQIIVGSMSRTLRAYANDTYGLLGHAYRSTPMLQAKPNEMLKFEKIEPEPMPQPIETSKLTVKERKRRKAIREQMKARYREKTEKRLMQQNPEAVAPEFCDSVLVEGLAWLDSLAGEELQPQSGILSVGDIWDSEQRTLDEIP